MSKLGVFVDRSTLSQLADDTAIILVNENNMASLVLSTRLCSPGSPLGRIVGLMLLVDGRSIGPLHEGSALSKDSLKGINILLVDFLWELDPSESTRVRAQIPARNQVTAWGLVVDLGRGREGHVEFWRKVKMEIEVFLWSLVLGHGAGEIGEGRRGRNHQQRQGLRARGGEGGLLAMLDVGGPDLVNGVEDAGVVVTGRHDGE